MRTRKPNSEELNHAVQRMSVLAFFPAGQAAGVEIVRILASMCATYEQLDWLVSTMIDRVGEWKGPKEMRGLFCTRYRPADGIEAECSIAGFTAADGEQRSIVAAAEEKHALNQAARKMLNSIQGGAR